MSGSLFAIAENPPFQTDPIFAPGSTLSDPNVATASQLHNLQVAQQQIAANNAAQLAQSTAALAASNAAAAATLQQAAEAQAHEHIVFTAQSDGTPQGDFSPVSGTPEDGTPGTPGDAAAPAQVFTDPNSGASFTIGPDGTQTPVIAEPPPVVLPPVEPIPEPPPVAPPPPPAAQPQPQVIAQLPQPAPPEPPPAVLTTPPDPTPPPAPPQPVAPPQAPPQAPPANPLNIMQFQRPSPSVQALLDGRGQTSLSPVGPGQADPLTNFVPTPDPEPPIASTGLGLGPTTESPMGLAGNKVSPTGDTVTPTPTQTDPGTKLAFISPDNTKLTTNNPNTGGTEENPVKSSDPAIVSSTGDVLKVGGAIATIVASQGRASGLIPAEIGTAGKTLSTEANLRNIAPALAKNHGPFQNVLTDIGNQLGVGPAQSGKSQTASMIQASMLQAEGQGHPTGTSANTDFGGTALSQMFEHLN